MQIFPSTAVNLSAVRFFGGYAAAVMRWLLLPWLAIAAEQLDWSAWKDGENQGWA